MHKKALGKGLESLMRESIGATEEKDWVTNIPMDKIDISEFQPRENFSEDELASLSKSIKEKGVLQPILVRPKGERFELIAGERRLRAAKRVNIKSITAVVRQVSDEEVLQLSLIENLQRADLTPVEEALAYKNLQDKFGLSQQEVADRVSKDRSTITNFLRLLILPKIILDKLDSKKISFGHAKALLSLDDESKRIRLCGKIIAKSLSVRDAERLVSRELNGERLKKEKKIQVSPELKLIEEQLSKKLGTKVQITPGRKRGKIQIEYYSDNDLERILSNLL